MNNENSLNKMELDLLIIKLKHMLKEEKEKNPKTYKLSEKYQSIISTIIEKLRIQKKIDFKSFSETLMKDKEIRDAYKKIEIDKIKDEFIEKNYEIFNKLSIDEKEFLKKYNYNIDNDIYNIFSTLDSPRNNFIDEWEELQIKKHNKSLHEYYKNRDWKDF